MITHQQAATPPLHPQDAVLQSFPAAGSLAFPERPRRQPASDAAPLPELLRATADALAVAPLRNRLLRALPRAELEEVQRHLEPVRFHQRQALFEAEEPIQHVYFPETMVVSLVSRLRDGSVVEVGTAGFEGMAGLPLFLGDESSSVRAFAQVPGTAMRMNADTFVQLAGPASALHRILLRYTQAFLTQVSQTAACNGAHLVPQRCARWLLMTHDRVNEPILPLTHEFLAFMLSVRRAGVTIAMSGLQETGLIRYGRGWVEVIDRAGLEAAACECYALVRAHTERLLPRGL
ncbi:MAG: Crp/Fnr family transcriptional regulator [Gemmatimonadetes bacterium]|nr:Crp/Fnr family transcriptional regulator [Gemmatimonadota bacterium]